MLHTRDGRTSGRPRVAFADFATVAVFLEAVFAEHGTDNGRATASGRLIGTGTGITAIGILFVAIRADRGASNSGVRATDDGRMGGTLTCLAATLVVLETVFAPLGAS